MYTNIQQTDKQIDKIDGHKYRMINASNNYYDECKNAKINLLREQASFLIVVMKALMTVKQSFFYITWNFY